MAQLKDLIVAGATRLIGIAYGSSLQLSGTLTLTNTTDLAGTSYTGPALVVGGPYTTAHMEIDANEIQAKTNSATTAALYLNNDGGTVYANGQAIVLTNDTRLSNARTPTAHASSATTYGVGTTANYGHVKLVSGNVNGQTYTDGVAAAAAHTHSNYSTTDTKVAYTSKSDSVNYPIVLGNAATPSTGGVNYNANFYYNPSTSTLNVSKIQVTSTQEASGTANNKPALIIGGTDAQTHIEIDANKIQAKTNGTSVATLWINKDGGDIDLGQASSSSIKLRGSVYLSTADWVRHTSDQNGGTMTINYYQNLIFPPASMDGNTDNRTYYFPKAKSAGLLLCVTRTMTGQWGTDEDIVEYGPFGINGRGQVVGRPGNKGDILWYNGSSWTSIGAATSFGVALRYNTLNNSVYWG